MTMPGRDRTLPAFVAGSHVDSVPQGGNYDGLAGVTAALTVAWWMHRHQVQLERDYTVLMMRCEESSYFGKAYVGSLGMMGRLTQSDLMLRNPQFLPASQLCLPEYHMRNHTFPGHYPQYKTPDKSGS